MKRDLIVTADGRDRTVAVEGPLPDGRFRVTLDGTSHDVDGRQIRPGTWSIMLDGRSYTVELDKRRTGIAASIGASEALLQVEDALHRRLANAAGGGREKTKGETIRAPIAGKVVKVLVAPGDTIQAGAAVIVLEAMKMENELTAAHGGTVSAVHKQAGQAVDTGDLLVDLT
jgi:biotin carboxyl carrier protein